MFQLIRFDEWPILDIFSYLSKFLPYRLSNSEAACTLSIILSILIYIYIFIEVSYIWVCIGTLIIDIVNLINFTLHQRNWILIEIKRVEEDWFVFIACNEILMWWILFFIIRNATELVSFIELKRKKKRKRKKQTNKR